MFSHRIVCSTTSGGKESCRKVSENIEPQPHHHRDHHHHHHHQPHQHFQVQFEQPLVILPREAVLWVVLYGVRAAGEAVGEAPGPVQLGWASLPLFDAQGRLRQVTLILGSQRERKKEVAGPAVPAPEPESSDPALGSPGLPGPSQARCRPFRTSLHLWIVDYGWGWETDLQLTFPEFAGEVIFPPPPEGGEETSRFFFLHSGWACDG